MIFLLLLHIPWSHNQLVGSPSHALTGESPRSVPAEGAQAETSAQRRESQKGLPAARGKANGRPVCRGQGGKGLSACRDLAGKGHRGGVRGAGLAGAYEGAEAVS